MITRVLTLSSRKKLRAESDLRLGNLGNVKAGESSGEALSSIYLGDEHWKSSAELGREGVSGRRSGRIGAAPCPPMQSVPVEARSEVYVVLILARPLSVMMMTRILHFCS
jgi:hypothetical protein